MNTKRFLIGALVGGIFFFLAGYLVYGNLLAEFFKTNTGGATNIERPMDNMVWWALIAGNLLFGALVSYVLNKSNANSMSQGMMTAGTVGLLMSSTINFITYATTNVPNLNAVFVDIACMTVLASLTGAIVAWSMHYFARPVAKTA
jgi:hypothetical protein